VSYIDPGLAGHPDRIRWNSRYGDGFVPSFSVHPLAANALSTQLITGPMLELACGPSGSALHAAASGRQVIAVDASDAALGMLEAEAERRGLGGLITLVHADLARWRPAPGSFALVLCTGFWDREVFGLAARAVAPGGLIGWEALTRAARLARPDLPDRWCLAPGEPASLLPGGFEVLDQRDVTGQHKRRMVARYLLSRDHDLGGLDHDKNLVAFSEVQALP
jgi:SAM-dependent methyltransferase